MSTDDVQRIEITLAQINTKLDVALANNADHETRIRRLEKVAYAAIGLASASGIGTGVLASILGG